MPAAVSAAPAAAAERKSQQACASCRIRKQRCDKTLPSCSRCASKLLKCNYDWAEEALPPVERHLPSRPIGTDSLLERLDASCAELSAAGARSLLEAASASDDPSALVGAVSEILDDGGIGSANLADEYFATVNRWLPVIEEPRFRERLAAWRTSGDSGLALLLWSFYLVSSRPCVDGSHSMDSRSYQSTRQLFMALSSGRPTLDVLQAGLLLAAYACGHGMARDAHIIIATCAALGRMLGLDVEEVGNPRGLDQEQLRCRLAIVILDRTNAISSFGNPVPLAVPSAGLTWNKDVVLNTDLVEGHPTFSVTSTVALLVSDALNFANDPRPLRLAGSSYSETHDRIESLIGELLRYSNTHRESWIFCESTSFAISVLLAFLCANLNEGKRTNDPKQTLHLQSVLRMVLEHCRTSLDFVRSRDFTYLPILAMISILRDADILVSLCGDDVTDEDLEKMRAMMEVFGKRWSLGRDYLRRFEKQGRVRKWYDN